MKVFKFGGASVKDADSIRNMATIIQNFKGTDKLLVVLSAMGKTTNRLESLYKNFVDGKDWQPDYNELKSYHNDIILNLFGDEDYTCFKKTERFFGQLRATLEEIELYDSFEEGYDQIICFGELLSTQIVGMYIQSILQVPLVIKDARELIFTDATFTEGKLNWELTKMKVKAELPNILNEKVVLTQGFIGSTINGKTTTLGREGSDYTAAIFSNILNAESLTIWKDVPGVLNADPKRYHKSELYKELSYHDAAEMTFYGATVIHPKTIKPLVLKQIPLLVKSFLEPTGIGTTIGPARTAKLAPAIIYKKNQLLLSISSFDLAFITDADMLNILETFLLHNVKINMTQHSAISISFAVDNEPRKITKLKTALEENFHIAYNEELELLTIKNYTQELIAQLTGDAKLFLQQTTRSTYQALMGNI